jgi:glycosyltransferase 2 family protein
VITGITVLGFWFIISRLADVDYAALWDALEHASWGWIIVALLLSQIARIAQAVSTMGAARHKLALGPTTAMQFAITFTNVAVPSTAARIAMEMRYFQKQGAPQAEALAAGALDSLSGFIGQLIILLITLGFGASSIDFDWSRLSIDIDLRRIGLLAALLVAAGLVSLFVVRRLRQWIRRFLAEAFGALRGLNSARRLLMLFGGNMAGEVLFASALGASALALGYHLSLADLMAINVLVGLFAGLMPLPSIGVTEAAITFGLTAAGLPETDALAAALLYRCTTFYFPPIWGYFALRWLTKNDYL